ncbi:DNA polymerase III subunit alpha [marine bacterium AO1-C]|nr:DNA polymerase III subunit alpha [marine bacterium AO1-C]
MYLIFDTETTGLPKDFNAPYTDLDNWPRLVQIAWQLHDYNGKLISAENMIVKPEGFTIPFNAEKVHGISTEIAMEEGLPLKEVLGKFAEDIAKSELIIGHNIGFDVNIMGAEYVRGEVDSKLHDIEVYDTKSEETAEYVAIQGGRGGKFKWPTLTELHTKLFNEGFDDAHDAAYDVSATARCYFGLISVGIAPPLGDVAADDVTYEPPVLDAANFEKRKKKKGIKIPEVFKGQVDTFIPFSHLHVHSQFSILQSTAGVGGLIKFAKENNMPAIAITDHGNMHAAFKAVGEGAKNDVKVIIGCEFYVAEKRTQTSFTKGDRDRRFNQVLLAKDQEAYHRLARLCSMGYIEGYYAGFPRVGKDLIEEHHEGLIALTGNLQGEIPNLILNVGEHEAEEAFKWWHGLFGDDFYVEIMRHGLEEEERVTEVLLNFAAKYGVKPIATNNVYYIDAKDADAHDSLLCVKGADKKSTPKMFTPDIKRRNLRYGMPNEEYYLKTPEEMNELFSDIPVALENTQHIVDKCSPIKLKRDILMPIYEMPPEFSTQDDYLRHLTYEGALKRYGNPLSDEVRERLDHELNIIKSMEFPGYFLIVQDFINAARDMGVFVGPGRGSAAGSAVAFCIGITNIDPIKYNLLFERFLNPERVSMPDVDIDFDDEGRQDAINYVIDKYGKNQVAQIITYGTMAAKMAIKDVARVLELPIPDSNKLAKYVPDKPGTKLKDAFAEVQELKDILGGPDDNLETQVLKQAKILEGSVRGTGIHAAGVIIAPDDLLKYIPVCTSKDADLLVTQFDGKVIEDAGMLKMDFLGLKTLTVIKDALRMVKKNYGIDIDMDKIPLDDQESLELYQKGETVGTFQFESEGMRMYLKQLKPTNIEDLIAMNALYRPGPLQFIPNFINRKHGREEVEYPHELLEPILNNTYGIMVYQEQIMQTAQILGGYTLGGADLLRRAMGKKKLEEMDRQEVIFMKGAKEIHNIPEEKSKKVFEIMKEFAKYGFNRSHSAAYSVVAYQTAYLKANYPSEYMASVLTHNMNNIDKVTFFIEETKNMGLEILGPDVNESEASFTVNPLGQIRFGLGAVKGTGDAAVENIIEERQKNGHFKDMYDFARRVNLRTVNKKSFECFAQAGAFDNMGKLHRAQFFASMPNEQYNFLEKIIRYGNAYQKEIENAKTSLFGDSGAVTIATPKVPHSETWSQLEKLSREKEVVGFYMSGHPLDRYRAEMKQFCKCTLDKIDKFPNQEITVAGIITKKEVRQTKTGKPFTSFSIEDHKGAMDMALFGESHETIGELIEVNKLVLLTGKVQKRYGSEDRFELRPSQVKPLEEMQEKMCKGLSVKIDIAKLNEDLISQMEKLVQENSGEHELKIWVYDLQEEPTMKVELNSHKYKIQADERLMQKFEAIELQCEMVY